MDCALLMFILYLEHACPEFYRRQVALVAARKRYRQRNLFLSVMFAGLVEL